jgi:CheY-like chemotaxis protein
MAQKVRYDLIILDLNMPLLDGFEAAPLIKIYHRDNQL